jgi:hypothetical protein
MSETLTVTGVPQRISRSQVRDWLAQLGIETTGLRRLEMNRDGIVAEVVALDSEGRPFAVGYGDDARVATHVVTIKIGDE